MRFVTPEQLAEIPEEYRGVIARWLVERGRGFRPSMVLSEENAQVVRDVLTGAAVDLFAPMADDGTLGHAAWVLDELGLYPDGRGGVRDE